MRHAKRGKWRMWCIVHNVRNIRWEKDVLRVHARAVFLAHSIKHEQHMSSLPNAIPKGRLFEVTEASTEHSLALLVELAKTGRNLPATCNPTTTICKLQSTMIVYVHQPAHKYPQMFKVGVRILHFSRARKIELDSDCSRLHRFLS